MKTKLVLLVVAAAIALTSDRLHATTVALSFTGGSTFTLSDATASWDFNLGTAASITDVGLWDAPSPGEGNFVGDGFLQFHLITIWETSTMTVVAQATVDNTGTLIDGFRYVSLAQPVLLASGNYTIGAYYPAGGSDATAINATTITTASGVTYDESVFASGNAFPAGGFVAVNSYFGPNFQFVAIPEPGSAFLVVLGIGTLMFRARRRNNARPGAR